MFSISYNFIDIVFVSLLCFKSRDTFEEHTCIFLFITWICLIDCLIIVPRFRPLPTLLLNKEQIHPNLKWCHLFFFPWKKTNRGIPHAVMFWCFSDCDQWLLQANSAVCSFFIKRISVQESGIRNFTSPTTILNDLLQCRIEVTAPPAKRTTPRHHEGATSLVFLIIKWSNK